MGIQVIPCMENISKSLFVISILALVASCGGANQPTPSGSHTSVTSPNTPSDSKAAGLAHLIGSAGSGSPMDPGIAGSGAGIAGSGAPMDPGTAGSGSAGSGAPSGTPNMAVCSGASVDLNSDPNHCGACGYPVVHGRSCVGGLPTPAWQPISTDGAPPPRTRHAASFLAGHFIVTGGSGSSAGTATATTGSYSPDTDTWSHIGEITTPRCSHGSVATAGSIFLFGGLSDCSQGGSVGPGLETYNASQDIWSAMKVAGEPEPRYNFAIGLLPFVSGILIYGGSNGSPAIASGGIFYPKRNAWDDASCKAGPTASSCARGGYLTAFEDDENPAKVAIVMGGNGVTSGLQFATTVLPPVWSNWTPPPGIRNPLPQRHADDGHRIFYLQSSTTDCSGAVMVLAYTRGGTGGKQWRGDPVNAQAPMGLLEEAAVAWSGSELIAWSGACGMAAPVPVGGRYQPPAP